MKLYKTDEDSRIFHSYLAEAIRRGSVSQFVQLCNDTYKEIKYEHRGFCDASMFFETYYSIGSNSTDIKLMGQFIKAGKHLKEISLYAKV